MKFVVIEDEPLSAKHIANLLRKINEAYKVVEVLDSVATAVSFLKKKNDFDIILADINLSDGTSFDVFSEVDVRVPVIFTTAFDAYAVRAFKLNSVDFLLKPVGIEELEASIEKAIIAKNDNPRGVSLSDMKYVLRKDYKRRFLVSEADASIAIKEEQISFFQSTGNVLKVCTDNKKKFPLNFTMEELEKLLDPTIFFRINKSIIVNYNAVEHVRPDLNGQLSITCKHLSNDDSFVSREKASDFSEWVKR